MTERLRLLLVEDDASLQRFVAMALEDEPVQLQICKSVDEALLALGAQRYDLIVTDLMLPGRSGQDLLQWLQAHPELRAQAVLAAFSAGLTGPVRAQLETLGVTRFLSKPCSLADLHACIREVASALPAAAAASAASPASAVRNAFGTSSDAGDTHPPVQPDVDADADADAGTLQGELDASAIDEFFGGNQALYEGFLAKCRVQFRADLETGRQAIAQPAPQTMRHLAHSLKSVLLTLGHPTAAAVARQLEDDAAASDPHAVSDAVRAGWARLDAALTRLL